LEQQREKNPDDGSGHRFRVTYGLFRFHPGSQRRLDAAGRG
jgi:hypothetical protein